MADIDVVVVNYLTGDDTRNAAASVAGPGTAIWLVDNSGELLADPPSGVTMLGDGTNAMYAAASNLAYEHGAAELVLLLNPDVGLGRAELEQLATTITADPALWAVAPALDAPDGRGHSYLRRLPTTRSLLADLVPPLRLVFRADYRRYLCRDLDATRDALVEQPAAACLLVRRSAVGAELFDEGYRLFFNDADLSRRMAAAGLGCRYVASIHATHEGGASIEQERAVSGTWVSDEYDRAALRYAREHLRGGAVFAVVVVLRRLVRRARHSWRRRRWS